MTETAPSPFATDDIDPALLEAGRKIFARDWTFLMSAPQVKHIPPEEGIEITFAGRSNVGKSSLINALTGQKGLARTSNTPGRTQALNFFICGQPLTLVDMPGYGYAEAPKETVDAWHKLIKTYLRGRSNLRRVYVLIDARHGIKKNDDEILKLLDDAAVSYQIVLTKADKIKPGALTKAIAAAKEHLRKRPAAHPEVLPTSSAKQNGLARLKAEIVSFLPAEYRI